MRKPAIHSAKFLRRHHEAVLLASADETQVTCLRCLYWLRLYIPIVHLRRHQRVQINMAYNGGCTDYESLAVLMCLPGTRE